MDQTIRLHEPHPTQRIIKDSKAKRKVLACGRRFGKTTLAADEAVEEALNGGQALFAAPTIEQVDFFWESVKWSLAEPLKHKYIYKNESRHLIEIPTGGRIKAKTAWNADTLRGDFATLLLLEEFSMMDFGAWDKVGAPMLLDNDGDAMFFSSPNRRNHFHRMFVRGLSDETGRWESFHATSFDNPYLSKTALAEITTDMTDEAYRQEIMAEFLENEGAVFRNILACMNAKPTTPAAHKDHRKSAGVDWGKQKDYTVISVGCTTCKEEITKDRFNKIDYTFQQKRLAELVKKWEVRSVLAESNAMGEPIIDQLRREGMPVRGFATTATTKPPLIENLVLTLERAEWQFLNDPIFTAELEAYERKVSASTGRSSYSAPEGLNDDTVIARALMVHGSELPYGAELVGFA